MVSFFELPKNTITGIDIVDRQHKMLAKATNVYFVKRSFDKGQEACDEFISFYEQYILSHFQAEEAFQREHKYSAASRHAAKHDMLKIKFKQAILELERTSYDDSSLALFDDMVNTIAQHVVVEDVKFAKFLAAKK